MDGWQWRWREQSGNLMMIKESCDEVDRGNNGMEARKK